MVQSVDIIICHFVIWSFKSMNFHFFFFFFYFFFCKNSYAEIIKTSIMKNIPKVCKLIKAIGIISRGL